MAGIAICSYSFIRLLYGERWTPAVPYMILACFTFALRPFSTINLRGIIALGRSDIFLKLEIIKKVVVLIVVLSCFKLGVLTWMTISAFVLGPFSVIVNSWPNRKLLNYTIGMQLRDVMPTALVCCAQAAIMLGIGFLADFTAKYFGIPDSGIEYMAFLVCKLALQFVLGSVAFIWTSYAFRLNPMGEYARMAATAIDGKFPRIARLLERRFSR